MFRRRRHAGEHRPRPEGTTDPGPVGDDELAESGDDELAEPGDDELAEPGDDDAEDALSADDDYVGRHALTGEDAQPRPSRAATRRRAAVRGIPASGIRSGSESISAAC